MVRERDRAVAMRRALAWALGLAALWLVLSLVVPPERAAAEPIAQDGSESLVEDPAGAIEALADATAASAQAAQAAQAAPESAAPVALPVAPDMVPVTAPIPVETRPVPTASAWTEAALDVVAVDAKGLYTPTDRVHAAVNDLPSSAVLVDSVGELPGHGAEAGLGLVDPALGLPDVPVLDPVLGLPTGVVDPIVDGAVEGPLASVMQPPPVPVPEILRDDGGAERAPPPTLEAAHPSPLAERSGTHAAAARSTGRYATPILGPISARGSDAAMSSALAPPGAVSVLAALAPLTLLRGSAFPSTDQDVPTGPAREHAPSPD